MNLKPYSNYKGSGLEWLSTVPSHWEINKIGRISDFTVGWTPPTGIQENFEGDNKWANISDLGSRTIYDTAKRISDHAVEISRLKLSPRGSLLFGFKLSVGDVSFAGTEMYTNEAIATFFESTLVSLQYAYYAYPLFIVENAGENIYGARILNQERIRNAKIAFPPMEDQGVIADFLDRETSEIDAFTADQERLIELLEERRAATITHAVTKGLDPNMPMKDSDIEWINETPVGWRIAKLRYLASVGTGSSDTVDATDDGDYTFFVRSQTPERIGHYSYDTEAVLTAGDGAGVGRVFHHFSGKFEAHQRVYVIQNFVEVKGRYIYYFMSTLFGPVILAGTAKSTVESLRRPMLTDFQIVLPPENEQEAIINFLDSETAKIDAAVADAREAIALSRERRAALISAAVTGQIDVAQYHRPVTEELEEEVSV